MRYAAAYWSIHRLRCQPIADDGVPALDEPLSDLILHRLFHIRPLRLSDLIFDGDECVLVLLLVQLLRDAASALYPKTLQLRRVFLTGQ